MIHHAAITSKGVVMVSGAVVYSVQLDYYGVPHIVSTTDRAHQVFTSNPLDFSSSSIFHVEWGGAICERIDVPCCPTCKLKCDHFSFLHGWIY